MVRLYLADDFGLDFATADCFHHSQMLEIIMRLEESVACEELHYNAPYAPNVAWVAPAKLKNDFGCAVVSC